MPIIDCPSSSVPWICQYWDILLYLIPSLLIAIVLRVLAGYHPIFFCFYLSGTILHEFAHLLAGFVTNARPVSMSIFPHRAPGNRWILGSASFANIRWYNAVFVGLAPVMVLLVPIAVGAGRLYIGKPYDWVDGAIAMLIAPAFLSFIPSRTDLRTALRSWPYLAAAGVWIWWPGQ